MSKKSIFWILYSSIVFALLLTAICWGQPTDIFNTGATGMRHVDLKDMPDALNTDHDDRYVNDDGDTMAGDLTFNGEGTGLLFGELYVADGSTAQSIATGATYTKLTGFTTAGLSNGVSVEAASDLITITTPGKYFVICSINGSSGTANVTFKYAAFLNGSEQNQVHMHRKFSQANDKGAGAMCGFIDVTSRNWNLDVRARHDNGGAINFTPTYMNLSIIKVGGT